MFGYRSGDCGGAAADGGWRMIRCEHCGEVFHSEDALTRRFEISDFHPPEIEYRCPFCGRLVEMEEVEQCQECGKWLPENLVEEGLCPACAGKTSRIFRDMLRSAFSEAQINFLANIDCF